MPPIYVETTIAGPLEMIWARTQQPEQHQRWDLRFSSITYLPRPDPAAPQRFSYTTRIGFGLTIAGFGETAGSRGGPDGQATSALRFWSEDWKSLIASGSGYWRYVPTPAGVRFLTGYDYAVRFGGFGRGLDRMFRPLIGWATAWSFDRLRLWVADELPPETALRNSLLHAGGAAALALLGLTAGAGALRGTGPQRRRRGVSALIASGAAAALVAGAGTRHVPLARRCLRRAGGAR